MECRRPAGEAESSVRGKVELTRLDEGQCEQREIECVDAGAAVEHLVDLGASDGAGGAGLADVELADQVEDGVGEPSARVVSIRRHEATEGQLRVRPSGPLRLAVDLRSPSSCRRLVRWKGEAEIWCGA